MSGNIPFYAVLFVKFVNFLAEVCIWYRFKIFTLSCSLFSFFSTLSYHLQCQIVPEHVARVLLITVLPSA